VLRSLPFRFIGHIVAYEAIKEQGRTKEEYKEYCSKIQGYFLLQKISLCFILTVKGGSLCRIQ